MKLFLLSLLVLTSLCFVLGDGDDIQPNFDDLIANDGQMVEDTPDDYAEDEEDSYMEDDEDFIPEDDDDANQTGRKKIPPGGEKRPLVDPTVEPTRPSKGEEQGSAFEPNKSDGPDFKDALNDKLGLNADSEDPEFTKK